MDNLTLKQLRYFEALAQHRHFGHAAEACAVTQPALSMQIKELESTLGSVLFERGGRQVRLTAFGSDFATRTREVLRAVEALADLARAAQQGPVGRLRLGVIPTIAPYLLPRIMAALNASHPGLDLMLRETVTPRLIAELADGRLDAAIVALPISEPGLIETPLFSEAFVLVRPAADADRPVPNPRDLQTMRLLLLEEGHCFRDQALSFCEISGTRPREVLDGTSLTTLVQMVAAGLGVTLIPEMAVPVDTRSAPVTVQRFADPQPQRSIGMIWRRNSAIARPLAQISEIVRATATS